MATIEWNQPADRIYEVGLDHGVLYLDDDLVVPWNGLTGVTHEVGSQGAEPLFFEGRKYADVQNKGALSVSINAMTYPDEFESYNGVLSPTGGFQVSGQNKKSFSMSYRTLIGDGISDLELGYRIHILYNLTAVFGDVENLTLGDSIDPVEFQWKAVAKEEVVAGYVPTAYAIADSRFLSPGALIWIQNILYGTESTSPFLPPLASMIEHLENSYVTTITDHGDGTWSADTPDENLSMASETEFTLINQDATYSDANTYDVSSF